MKTSDILQALAIGLEAVDKSTEDPTISAATRGAAVIIRALVTITTDRTVEESIKLLEKIRDEGAKPVSQLELDAQLLRHLP